MLCQQPLEAEARARMARFEDFIQKDTEQQAREAEKAAQTARQTIAAGAIGTRAVKASLDELGLQNEVLQQQTRRFIAAARLRRHVLLKALGGNRSEEHTSELQSLMRLSYAVFCLKKKQTTITPTKSTKPCNTR